MTPTRMARPTRIIVCTTAQPDVVSLSTDLEFYVSVETNATKSSGTETTDVTAWVSAAAIDTIASAICRGPEENGKGGRRLEFSPCVLSISSGTPDTRIVGCKPEAKMSQSCAWYRGTLRLVHTDACSATDVTKAAFAALTAINTDEFLASVNPSGASVEVTNATFAKAPGKTAATTSAVTEMSPEVGRDQLTAGGVIVVLLTGMTLAAAMILLLVARRRIRPSQPIENMKIVNMEQKRSKEVVDDGSYVEPDWGDLGGSHSSVDSHRCNSATCKMCRPQLDGVKMLQVNDNGMWHPLQGLRTFSKDEEDNGDKKTPSQPVPSEEADRNDMHIHGLAREESTDLHDNFEVTADMEDVLVSPCTSGEENPQFVRKVVAARSQSSTETKSVTL